MRLPWSKRGPDPADAPPTPHDRWMRIANLVCLALSILLLIVSIGPALIEAAAPNEGADINITTEFYTAFDGGGGYITWDFAPRAASELRGRIDAAGNNDGSVDNSEFLAYSQGVDDAFTRQVLVYRHFEIGAVKVIESRGIQLVSLNASTPAHLKILMNGQWAAQDGDIVYWRDQALQVAYGNLSGWETVRERTLIIAGGGSTFTPLADQARVLRVPGGSIVVATQTDTSASAGGGSTNAVHIARFSPADSTWVLLVPLAIGYFLGLRAPRREQESSGHTRIAPFHSMLAGGFLLLLAAYFAGVLGVVVWAGGIAYGIIGLWLSFRLYPAERPPPAWEPVGDAQEPTAPRAAAARTSDAAFADPVSTDVAARDPDPGVGPREQSHDSARRPSLASPGIAAAPAMVQTSRIALELPDEDTPPPVGRGFLPSTPSRPTPPKAPLASVAAPAKSTVRCPGCKHQFEAEGKRPLSVTCPHCGRRGVLR